MQYHLLLIICIVLSVFLVYKKWYFVSLLFVIVLLYCNSHWQVFTIKGLCSNRDDRDGIMVSAFNIDGSGYHCKLQVQNLADFIINQQADVVFLAEDFDGISNMLDSLLDVNYPYSTFHTKYSYGGHYFYSKYPLGNVEHLEIESNRFSYCYYCKVAYKNDSLSIFGVHMASNNYKGNEASIGPEDIDGISSLNSYFDNIELASKQRCEEANAILTHNNGTPAIIMGDFNDVCGSAPLNLLESAGFNDAWWKGGFGYGATIYHPLPYRIDHIMYNDGLKLVDIKKVDSQGLSDHDALVAEFEIESKVNKSNKHEAI